MQKKIRCGVAGVGYLGQHHARVYSELEHCELVGIYEVNAERAREISERHQCKVFNSPEELGEACDAVSVVVPTDKHCEVALQLLAKNCHLLIEKPICTSLEEAGKILDAAKQHQSIIQVGHIEHFNPVMGFLERAVKDPRYITADRLAPFTPRGTEVGVVLDLMIHDIGIILQLANSPIKQIDAVGVRVLSNTEDIANARITFENGCVANINTSRVSLKKLREIRVFQPFSYLSFDFMNQTGHLLKKDGINLIKEEVPLEKGEPLKLELDSFVHCIIQSQEPKVGGPLGRAALEAAIKVTELIRSQGF